MIARCPLRPYAAKAPIGAGAVAGGNDGMLVVQSLSEDLAQGAVIFNEQNAGHGPALGLMSAGVVSIEG